MGELTYLKNERTLNLWVNIYPWSGDELSISFGSERVISYTVDTSISNEGFPVGSVESAEFSLVIDNTGDNKRDPSVYKKAFVRVRLGILGEDKSYVYTDLGCWIVDSMNLSEQDVSIELIGYDVLKSASMNKEKTAGTWSSFFKRSIAAPDDNERYYRRFLKDYVDNHTIAAFLDNKYYPVYENAESEEEFNIGFDTNYVWPPTFTDNFTDRDMLGYVAAAAGGFVRNNMKFDGKRFDIVQYGFQHEYNIGPDYYIRLERGNPTRFEFNQAHMNYDSANVMNDVVDDSIESSPMNTITFEPNPIIGLNPFWPTYQLKENMKGFVADSTTLTWVGDPEVKVGDILNITTTTGDKLRMVITHQRAVFDGGFSMVSECAVPTETSTNADSYQGYRPIASASDSPVMEDHGIELTGERWADGKLIYKVVFSSTYTGQTSIKEDARVQLGMIEGVDSIIRVEGCIKSSTYTRPVPWTYANSSGTGTQAIDIAYNPSDSFFYMWSMNTAVTSFYVVVYYTLQASNGND